VPAPETQAEEAGGTKVCYLDTFLESVTEDKNLPADVKRSLAQLRDLDTQAQEQYERMQKQSKNHVARAKRSVQGGHEPDEELLHKARRQAPPRQAAAPHPRHAAACTCSGAPLL